MADWSQLLVVKTRKGWGWWWWWWWWQWWWWWWWWSWWLEPLRKPACGEPWQLQVLLHLHCPHCSTCLCIPSDVSNENKRWRQWTIRQAKSTEEAGGGHSDDSSCFFLQWSLFTPHLPLHFLSPPYLQSEFVFQTTIKRHPDKIEILEIAFKSFRQVNTQKGNFAEKITANVLNSSLILFFPSILSFFSKLSQFLANQKNVPIGFFFHALYWLQFRQVELNSQI